MATNKYIEQAKNLLFSFKYHIGYVIVFCAFLTLLSHLIYFHILWNYILYRLPVETYNYPLWYLNFELYLNHFFDISGLLIFVFWSFYDKLKEIAKYSLYLLTSIFIVNCFYVFFQKEAELYFYIIMSLFYITFVVLTLRSLTNR